MDNNQIQQVVVPLFTGISGALLQAAPSLLGSALKVFAILYGAYWLKRLFHSAAFENPATNDPMGPGPTVTDADYFDPRNAASRRHEGVFTDREDDGSGEYHGHFEDEDEERPWYE